jgi:nitroreductase
MRGPAGYPVAYGNVRGLRAVRSFSDQPLSDPHLHAILEAGRWTGSSKNRQSWAVVVITDPEQKDRIAECGDFTEPIRRAPIAIALVREQGGNDFDIGRLAQNLMLAANALGVASCPITFHRSDDAGAVLGLPDGSHCRYGIAIGYPGGAAPQARFGGRKPLDEFVRWNSY